MMTADRPGYLKLQDPVPQFASIRQVISNDVYAQGPAAFLIEGVPFNYTVSRDYARQIIAVLMAKLTLDQQQATADPVVLYEFGAGIGVLARQILDILSEDFPHIYARTQLFVSDISDAAIASFYGIAALEAGRISGQSQSLCAAYPICC